MDVQLTFRDERDILAAEYVNVSPSVASRFYSIGELAAGLEIAPAVIRSYEEQGLLTPTRAGRLRVYSEKDKQRLTTIVGLRKMGLPASHMTVVLDANEREASAERNRHAASILRSHLDALHDRLGDVQGMIERTSAVLSRLARAAAQAA